MAKVQHKIVPIKVGKSRGSLNQSVVDREKNRLVRYYQIKLDQGKTSKTIRSDRDIIKSVERSVKKALDGYNRAAVKATPEATLITRLSFLTRYNKMPEIWEDGVLSFPDEDSIVRVAPVHDTLAVKKDEGDVEYLEIRSKEEAKFLKARRQYYLSEFEFNKSSDQILLESVLADEILLRRHQNIKLKGESYVADNVISELQKRLRENLVALGVSRKQRISDSTANKGSVSQISDVVEKKLENIRLLTDEAKREKIIRRVISHYASVSLEDMFRYVEEIDGMRTRSLRPEMETLTPISSLNALPEMMEIDQLLSEGESHGDSSPPNEGK